jgi:electron transport complex protein RnfE
VVREKKQKTLGQIFMNGIVDENPILVLMIGLCPLLAVSGTANDAFGMGVATIFVLVCSNVLVSLLRKFIPAQIRIPIFIVIISSFVTIVDLTMHGFQPELYKNLGIFVPLIVVNCMILGRSEAFAFRHDPLRAFVDGLGMGIGFIIVITILGAVREILGNGTISLFNTELVNLGENYKPALLFIMPPGGFLTIGFLMALKKKFSRA